MRRDELTSIERAVFVAWRMAEGDEFTTAEVAVLVGLTWQGAYYLMTTASRILPIYQDDKSKIWKLRSTSA